MEFPVLINNNPKATGFIDDLNMSQYEALKKFKEKLLVNGVLKHFHEYDDLFLLKFLRARKFDVEQSYKMITDYFHWRLVENIAEIHNFMLPELRDIKKYYPHGHHKVDKLGRPIYIEKLGEVKLNELYHVTTEDRLLKMYMREYEKTIFRLKACSKYAGRLVEQTLAISDMKDISINAARKAKAFIQKASSIGQNYYPEMLGKMFLINTSTIFKIVWALVKGFMDKKTRDKMIMLGSDYRSTLLEYVDKENLPTFLGGTCTCSHIPGGCIYSDVGPWNPEGGMEC